MPLSKRNRALLLLTAQSATIALVTRTSRLGHHDELYLPSSAVLLAEILKGFISWLILAHEHAKDARDKKEVPERSLSALYYPLREAFSVRRLDLLKLAVPALLYAGQNNLLYVALSNLSASTYQVTYQLKILTTALLSVFLFRRQYSSLKWLSLFLLTAGVAIVQLPDNIHQQDKRSRDIAQNQLVGFSAIFVACISSAIAGCYFETVLKPTSVSSAGMKSASSPSLSVRNLQLAVASLPFDLLGILLPQYDRARVLQGGLFDGFTPLACFVVLNQAVGGLLIAAVVKEADSVSKGFATSLAVILSAAISSFITQSLPSKHFAIGAGLVIIATAMFAIVP